MSPAAQAREIVEEWQHICAQQNLSPMRGYSVLDDLITTALAQRDALAGILEKWGRPFRASVFLVRF